MAQLKTWTPYEIEMVLHYHCSVAPFPRNRAPAFAPTVKGLISAGILETRPELFCYKTTALGAALVDAWCATPQPPPDGAVSVMAMPTDPDWYKRKAELEGDHEIGAGKRLTATINPWPAEIAEMEQLAFEALPQWAQKRIRELEATISAQDAPSASLAGWPTLDEAFERAYRAAEDYYDAAANNEADWTGWGEQIVPPAATMCRVKAKQAFDAIRDSRPSKSAMLAAAPSPEQGEAP